LRLRKYTYSVHTRTILIGWKVCNKTV